MSTAPAPRKAAPQPSRLAFYECRPQGADCVVRIGSNLLDRLARAHSPSNNLPAQGVLLGVVRELEPKAVTIEDFQPVEDEAKLIESLSSWRQIRTGQVAALGYYRWGAAPVLEVGKVERTFWNRHFRRNHSVVLLLVPQKSTLQVQVWLKQEGAVLGRTVIDHHGAQASVPTINEALPAPAGTNRFWRNAWFLLVLLLVGFSFWAINRAGVESNSSAPELTLAVERRGDSLELTWDKRSSLSQHALAATIQVNDGGIEHNVTLRREGLAQGRFVYFPSGSEVTFRMVVINQDGARTLASIQTLSAKAPATLALAPQVDVKTVLPPPVTPPSQPKPALRAATPVAAAAAIPASAPPAPALPPPPRKVFAPFIVHVSTPRIRPAESSELKDLPQPPRIEGVVPLLNPFPLPVLPGYRPPDLNTDTPSLLAQLAVAKLPEPARIVETTPATVLHSVQPFAPSSARWILVSPTDVAVKVTVDATGRVTKAEPDQQLRGAAVMLLPYCLDAARKWRFSPARINGIRVPTELSIHFRFSPPRSQ